EKLRVISIALSKVSCKIEVSLDSGNVLFRELTTRFNNWKWLPILCTNLEIIACPELFRRPLSSIGTMQPLITLRSFELAFQRLCATQRGNPRRVSIRCINEVLLLGCSNSPNRLERRTRSSMGIL